VRDPPADGQVGDQTMIISACCSQQLMATGMGLMVVGKANPGRAVLE